MGLQFIPTKTNIDFMGKRYWTFLASLGMVILTIFLFFFQGLNYGVDFKGGLLLEIRTQEAADFNHIRRELSPVIKGEISLQEFGSPRDVLVRLEHQPIPQEEAIQKIKTSLGPNVEYRRIETVGAKVGEELIVNSLFAIGWALLAMLGYIWFRFEWQFSVCAIAALIHDCIAIVGLFALFRFEFNETAIIAILITATYSINDTVVIFDRIRENMRKFKKMPFGELMNNSLNETLSRTILTSATTLLALLVLYFLGGPIIASFCLPIIVGITVGTYSSIFLASPLLLYLGLERPKKA